MKNRIAKMIDHTLLKSSAGKDEIIKLCMEAKEYNFASVCVNPCYVQLVNSELMGTEVKTCTVIGFPLGANLTEIKAEEAAIAVKQGADEIDMVINIGALKNKDFVFVENDIKAVVKASGKALVKVIVETCFLTEEEKIKICSIIKQSGADFIKTSTGFGSGGAQVEDIKLFRKELGDSLKIKASGGIKNLKDAQAMIEAGADRLGTSSGIAIVFDLNTRG